LPQCSARFHESTSDISPKEKTAPDDFAVMSATSQKSPLDKFLFLLLLSHPRE
jgi:hypothetical protein